MKFYRRCFISWLKELRAKMIITTSGPFSTGYYLRSLKLRICFSFILFFIFNSYFVFFDIDIYTLFDISWARTVSCGYLHCSKITHLDYPLRCCHYKYPLAMHWIFSVLPFKYDCLSYLFNDDFPFFSFPSLLFLLLPNNQFDYFGGFLYMLGLCLSKTLFFPKTNFNEVKYDQFT